MLALRGIRLTTKDVVLIVVCVLLFFLYGMENDLHQAPQALHLWRQTDCLAFIQFYYEKSTNLFVGGIKNYGVAEQSNGLSEFPVIYYLTALLWKLGLPKYLSARLLNLLIFGVATWAFYRLLNRYFNKSWLVIGILICFLSSPGLIYYSHSFMPNVPALSFSILGLYFFDSYHRFQRQKALWTSFLFFTLSILIKPTAGILFMSLLGIFLLELLGIVKTGGHWFQNKKKLGAPFGVTIFINIAWIAYVIRYNQIYNSAYFVTAAEPIWNMEWDSLAHAWSVFKQVVKDSLLNSFLMLIALPLVIFNLSMFKKYPRLVFCLLFLFLGSIVYLLLFFNKFVVKHDYYLIELLPFLFANFSLALYFISREISFENNLLRRLVWMGCVQLLVISIYHCAAEYRIRFNSSDWLADSSPFISSDEKGFFDYASWEYSCRVKPYIEVKDYLDSIGVGRDDLIYTCGDYTGNASLVFTERYGYTEMGLSALSRQERVEKMMQFGLKYLIIPEEKIKEELEANLLTNRVGKYKNLEIFKIEEQQL